MLHRNRNLSSAEVQRIIQAQAEVMFSVKDDIIIKGFFLALKAIPQKYVLILNKSTNKKSWIRFSNIRWATCRLDGVGYLFYNYSKLCKLDISSLQFIALVYEEVDGFFNKGGLFE